MSSLRILNVNRPSLSNSDLFASRILVSLHLLWIGISSSGRLAVRHLNLARQAHTSIVHCWKGQ